MYNNNDIKLTDFLFSSRIKNINIKSQRHFQTSNSSINYKRYKNCFSSKYSNKHNELYRSVNSSKNKEKFTPGNSYELNTKNLKKINVLKNINSHSVADGRLLCVFNAVEEGGGNRASVGAMVAFRSSQ